MKVFAAALALSVLFAPIVKADDAGGWKPLFDGKTSTGWRGFRKKEFPRQGWVIENGTFHHLPKGGGGDIITDAVYDEFDLRFEWKIAKGGNSGVKYFILEERGQAIGHEFQTIDDVNHEDAKRGLDRTSGAFYAVVPPSKQMAKPAGEWNEGRIIVHGNHVEHWLNGTKVVEYELGSPEVKAAIAKSKFKDVKGFGEKVKGHLLLQDHGDEVWFRNLQIR